MRVDKSPGTELGAYSTFGFFEHPATDRGAYSSIITAHLRQATRARLERLGYRYDERFPQLRIDFLLNVANRQEIRSGPGAFPRLGGSIETVDYRAGALGIALVDVKAKAVVWQGIAEGRISREASQQPGAALDQIVADLFRDFPRSAGT